MCVSDEAASQDDEKNGEIDCSLLKCVLLLRTVLFPVWNMGERVLSTVQALSEVAKMRAERRGR